VSPIEKDPFQRKLEITNWLLLLFIVACSAFFLPAKFTLGIACGGLISIVNYHWLSRSLRKLFQNLTGSVRSAYMLRYYLRFGVTAVVLYVVLSRSLVDVIGLLIGLSLVVINIVATVIMMFAKKNPAEEVCIRHVRTPVDP
jgi:hypothetical protein